MFVQKAPRLGFDVAQDMENLFFVFEHCAQGVVKTSRQFRRVGIFCASVKLIQSHVLNQLTNSRVQTIIQGLPRDLLSARAQKSELPLQKDGATRSLGPTRNKLVKAGFLWS